MYIMYISINASVLKLRLNDKLTIYTMYIESCVSWYAYQIRMANLTFEYRPCPTRRLFEPDSSLRIVFYNFQASSMSPCHILAWQIPKDSKIYPANFFRGEILLPFFQVNHGFGVILGVFPVFPRGSSHGFSRCFRVFSVYLVFLSPSDFPHQSVLAAGWKKTCLENWDRREHMRVQPEKGRCMNLKIYKANLIIKRIWSILVILGGR